MDMCRTCWQVALSIALCQIIAVVRRNALLAFVHGADTPWKKAWWRNRLRGLEIVGVAASSSVQSAVQSPMDKLYVFGIPLAVLIVDPPPHQKLALLVVVVCFTVLGGTARAHRTPAQKRAGFPGTNIEKGSRVAN